MSYDEQRQENPVQPGVDKEQAEQSQPQVKGIVVPGLPCRPA